MSTGSTGAAATTTRRVSTASSSGRRYSRARCPGSAPRATPPGCCTTRRTAGSREPAPGTLTLRCSHGLRGYGCHPFGEPPLQLYANRWNVAADAPGQRHGSHGLRPELLRESEKDAMLAQKLGQIQPFSCIPSGMHGPTCIFWANLTPFSLQLEEDNWNEEMKNNPVSHAAPNPEPIWPSARDLPCSPGESFAEYMVGESWAKLLGCRWYLCSSWRPSAHTPMRWRPNYSRWPTCCGMATAWCVPLPRVLPCAFRIRRPADPQPITCR